MTTHDVAVIGAGAAGLSAALVLTRARRSVVVIDAGRPRNAPAAHLQGFLSRDGTPPAELLRLGRSEVASYGGDLRDDTVTDVRRHPVGTFTLQLASAPPVVVRRVLVATGLRDEVVDVDGLGERWGTDVLHCPYCHGHEVRDQALGVLGGSPMAVQHALLVRQWSQDVVFFPHTTLLDADDRERLAACQVDVVEGDVARVVVEDDRLSGVEMADGWVVPRTAVFVRPTFVANDDLLTGGLGVRVDAQGWAVVDATGRTSVPGVWAAGNAVDPRAQVITAAGEGSAAAIAINNDLTEDDVRAAVIAARTTTDTREERTPVPHPTTRTAGPPSKHQLALMIWLCVFPTLSVINLTLADWLGPMPVVLRTFVLATIAVPIVIYGLMPHLHRARVRVITARSAS